MCAADYVKYSFPIATSMTMLAWSLVEFSGGYAAAGSLNTATSQLRWGADYLMRAHTTPSSFVVQVRLGLGPVLKNFFYFLDLGLGAVHVCGVVQGLGVMGWAQCMVQCWRRRHPEFKMLQQMYLVKQQVCLDWWTLLHRAYPSRHACCTPRVCCSVRHSAWLYLHMV